MTDTVLPAHKCRVVVLISGNGSNLQALIDASQRDSAGFQIVCVISNRAGVYGLKRAEQAGIPAQILNHKKSPDRNHYDQILIHTIDRYQPDLVALAGFMRVLGKTFVTHFQNRLLNIHPSLLPNYRGLHTHQRVIENHEQEHGATVHFVTEELDGGPLILQSRIPVLSNDNADTLAQRVLLEEHRIYPLTIEWFAHQRLYLRNNIPYFAGKPLTKPLTYQEMFPD